MAIAQHLVVHIGKRGQVDVGAFIGQDMRCVQVGAKAIRRSLSSFHVQRGFIVAARGSAIDVNAVDVIRQVAVLALEAGKIAVG